VLEMENGISHKRRRLDMPSVPIQEEQASTHSKLDSPTSRPTPTGEEVEQALRIHPPRLISLDRSISPPKSNGDRDPVERATSVETTSAVRTVGSKSHESIKISSPIQLTRIRDLDGSKNVDTVGLDDILGNPLIRECWQFNYLFDVDFLM
jgi:tyrosyl-DNA phosphodiesterase-1